MEILKKYRLEEVCSKGDARYVLHSVFVSQNGNGDTWAMATDGKILAKVPVIVENGELGKGNSIKAQDLKHQKSNPNLKKKDNVLVCLEPLDGEFPEIDKVFPSGEPTLFLRIDITLLNRLCKGLGADMVKLAIYEGRKTPLVVTPLDSSANGEIGLMMPILGE